jgi:hypothetical protein
VIQASEIQALKEYIPVEDLRESWERQGAGGRGKISV